MLLCLVKDSVRRSIRPAHEHPHWSGVPKPRATATCCGRWIGALSVQYPANDGPGASTDV